MRPILLLILTISVTLLGTSTWAETPKEKWEGYKPVAEAGLPAQVKEFAENSVFFMQSVDSAPGQEMEIIDLENDPRAKTRVTDKKSLTQDLVIFQIETCRKQKLRYCPIAKSKSLGTAFFNKNKFYTCRHGFHNWLSVAAEANNRPVEALSPPMILRVPKKGQPGKFTVVYQSAFEADPIMKFSFINNNPNLNFQFDENDPSSTAKLKMVNDSDFVEMNLPAGRSKYIKDYNLAVDNSAGSTKHQEVYGIGYPFKTSSPKLGDGNSPGFELSATNGHILGSYNANNIIYSSNFVSEGMSGGPILSSEGKILGMNCSGYDMQKANSNPEQVNMGFFPLNTDRMADAWSSADVARSTTNAENTSVLN